MASYAGHLSLSAVLGAAYGSVGAYYYQLDWGPAILGAGLTTIEQYILNEERMYANAPRVGGTGAMFLGNLLMVHGTPEQQAKYMPPIVRGWSEVLKSSRASA